jgi:hypothetical protein
VWKRVSPVRRYLITSSQCLRMVQVRLSENTGLDLQDWMIFVVERTWLGRDRFRGTYNILYSRTHHPIDQIFVFQEGNKFVIRF